MNSKMPFFKNDKVIIGVLHLKGTDDEDTQRRAIKEFEIYRDNGVDAVLVETYFGTYHQAESFLGYLQQNAGDMPYGVNCLNVDAMGFELANQYGCQFLQIDSVVGHVKPRDEESIAAFFDYYRKKYPHLFLLGGVRFKYQAVLSEHTLEEDLVTAMGRCDAICVTQNATGEETDIEKIKNFRNTIGEFPLIICSGVRSSNVEQQLAVADGAVVGSYFKDNYTDTGDVDESHVEEFMAKVKAINAKEQ